MKSQTIDLTFTRDITLFFNEFWDTLVADETEKVFGIGVKHQIFRFHRRTVEIFRIREEMQRVGQYMVQKSPDDGLFSRDTYDQFIRKTKETHALLKQLEGASLKKRTAHIRKLMNLFRSFYPYVMLSNFLPGPWRKPFLEKHGTMAEPVVDRWFEARAFNEGTAELIDAYWRSLIGEHLALAAISPQFARVVRVSELDTLISSGEAPDMQDLQKRNRGYVYYHGVLDVDYDFGTWLAAHNFVWDDYQIDTHVEQVTGQVTHSGGIVRGKARVLLNVDDVASFPKGAILVTTMTSPEFVPAMSKAAAIVTDEGGITCHAAIVSRELGVPCVIGTRHASRIFSDDDVIEADTDTGVVKKR